jgi:hypothetical protein
MIPNGSVIWNFSCFHLLALAKRKFAGWNILSENHGRFFSIILQGLVLGGQICGTKISLGAQWDAIANDG